MTASTSRSSAAPVQPRARSASLASPTSPWLARLIPTHIPKDVRIKSSEEADHRKELVAKLNELQGSLRVHRNLLTRDTLTELPPWVQRVQGFVNIFHMDHILLQAAEDAREKFPWIVDEVRSGADHPPRVVQQILRDVLAGKDPKIRERLVGEASERFRKLVSSQAVRDPDTAWSRRWVTFCRSAVRWVDDHSPCDYLTNYTARAKRGELDPIVGRDEFIARCWTVLSRKKKSNIILRGEPGVGKSAIVEGLAQFMVKGKVPPEFASKQIFSLDVTALQAGAERRGTLQARLQELTSLMERGEGTRILFIDEIHTIFGVRGFADHLKPAVVNGKFGCIGATTFDEYRNHVAKDPAFARRFQVIDVPEMSIEDGRLLLHTLATRYERHYGFPIATEAIDAAVNLSHQYLRRRRLPDKAIDILEIAASQLRVEQTFEPRSLTAVAVRYRNLLLRQERLGKENLSSLQQRLDAAADLGEKVEAVKQKLSSLQTTWQVQKKKVEAFRSTHSTIVQKQEALAAARLAETVLGSIIALVEGVLGSFSQWTNDIHFDINRLLQVLQFTRDGKGFSQPLKRQRDDWVDRKDKLRKEIHHLKGKRTTQLEAWEEDSGSLRLCLEEHHIVSVLAGLTGIPLDQMYGIAEPERDLADQLKKRVKGQDKVIQQLVSAISMYRMGLRSQRRPAGIFLFRGSTGVGKTEVAKALAEALFGAEERLIRIDMSEMRSEHSVARLIGAPPGYVGYKNAGQLTEALDQEPYSVVLLDEMGKAHPGVFYLFLQLFDEGRLTDGQGKVVDARNAFFIMTTNPGDEGFKEVAPEFEGRVDLDVTFDDIGDDIIRKIFDMRVAELGDHLRERHGLELSYNSQDLFQALVAPGKLKGGARGIARRVDKELGWKVAGFLQKQASIPIGGKLVVTTREKGALQLSVEGETV